MMDSATEPIDAAERPISPDILQRLVDNHSRFLAFLERRVRSRALAEDILQDAFVRGLARGGSIRDEESAVAWFYRLLRNAAVDHYRRRGVEARALEDLAREMDEPAVEPEIQHEICRCVGELVHTLKPQYAAAIRRVDLDGAPVKTWAEEEGITPNNAAVRLHRARVALARQLERSCGTCLTHGCLDCTCGGKG
jgi:RNA polymerase sigma-70 factor (ECF subfamily)